MRGLLILPVVFAAVSVAPRAQACATCFGASDAPMAQGLNLGILSLLGVVGCVLVAIASFFVVLATRSARVRRREAGSAGAGAESVTL
jgi:hypothetical protein